MHRITNKNDFLTILITNNLVCKMEILTSVFLPIVFNPLSL